MPSITAYSPYETLAFFQSVARHGADASALQSISTFLKENENIHDNATSDATRFSVDALRHLYDEYVNDEKIKSRGLTNGDSTSGERSPKRRKLSNSTRSLDGALSENSQLERDLVDRLYSTYKENIILEIKRDEEAFAKLQDEISQLEKQIEVEANLQTAKRTSQPTAPQVEINGVEAEKQKALNPPSAVPQPPQRSSSYTQDPSSSTPTPGTSNENVNITVPDSQRQGTKSPLPRDSVTPRPPSVAPQNRVSQPPALSSNTQPSPGAISRQLPSPSTQRSNYGPPQTQPVYSPGQAHGPNHAVTQVIGAPPRPLPRGQHAVNQGRGSPMPYQGQHPYPSYPQYPPPPPPQWHPHMSSPQYQQHTPYGPPPPYYAPPQGGRHPQTPQQMSYPAYPHTAPMPYMQQQQQQWRGQPWPVHSASSATTPVSRPDSRLSMVESESSTPWKRKQESTQIRGRSLPRPEREVSPLTDREISPMPVQSKQERKAKSIRKMEDETPSHKPSEHQNRAQSVTPSADSPSRSQSRASRASDAQHERHRRGQLIKAEPPSTPLPVASSDNEQRSSGRRGRPRSSTITSQAGGVRITVPKRKRDSHSPASPVRSPQPSVSTSHSRRVNQIYDPSLVVVSKNFAKTSQLLISEITSHKLAGIFAKPLSERDAPGYKDLILRPQDLKSIKAAISKGSRAALAVIEAMEGDSESGPAKSQSFTGSSNTGPIGNGFYLVPKSVDLMPPKGIVNSAQLEMELVRMFANAIMFNPLSSAERGFGRSLRLRKNGGDVDPNSDPEGVSTSGESESGSSSGADEDGIIPDAREMFNDVVETVGKWRELEGERMGTGTDVSASRHGSLATPMVPTMESGRHASVSASSNIGDEDTVAGESEAASTPVPATTSSGPGRKRRKLADH